jgi:ribosomal protein S18 acetylase RimI-like enzyme
MVFRAPADIADNQEYWAQYLAQSGSLSLVAEIDKAVVGFITTEVIGETHPLAQPVRYVRMGGLCVAPSIRGKGVGRSLVAAAERWAIEQGAAEIRLIVWKFNRPAVDLYESMGFATRSFTMSKRLDSHVA